MKSEGNSRVQKVATFPTASLTNTNRVMTIKLQISDAVYASLLKGNARVQGTIALVSPREGNFNVHNRKREYPAREYRKLPHGRVSMSSENLRLTLSVDFDEHGIHPAQVLIDESITASQYIMGTEL